MFNKFKNNKEFKTFMFALFIIYVVFVTFLNESFTTDHVSAYVNYSNMFKYNNIGTYISGGRFTTWFYQFPILFMNIFGVNIYSSKYIYEIILMVTIAMSITLMYRLFENFCTSTKDRIILFVALMLSFVNPYFAECFVYGGIEWGFGILLAIWTVYLFKDKKFIWSFFMLFLTIGSYQSFVVIVLILETIYIFLEVNGFFTKKALKNISIMFLIASVCSLINISIVKIVVLVSNAINQVDINQKNLEIATEVKHVELSTGLFQRLYNICAAYWGMTYTSYGVFPHGLMLGFIMSITLMTMLVMLLKHDKCAKLFFYFITVVMVNVYCAALYGVIGGTNIGMGMRKDWQIFLCMGLIFFISYRIAENIIASQLLLFTSVIFILFDIYATNTSIADFYIANKLDTQLMLEIQQQIFNYEQSSGEEITTIAVAYAGNADTHQWSNQLMGSYEIWTYHRSTIYNSWGTVSLLNYINNTNYEQIDMELEDYNRYFAGKTWDCFDPSKQLVFDGNTMLWCIY